MIFHFLLFLPYEIVSVNADSAAPIDSCLSLECASRIEDNMQNATKPVYNIIAFEPESLEFSEVQICIPQVQYISIRNLKDEDVFLASIYSDSFQFHPVFPNPKTILPSETLSIEIVFFPYYYELAKAQLSFNFSIGMVQYQVSGQGIQNPYHLHPILGNKLTTNSTYEQPIIMYNPHSEILHIREIYTTESFLSLQGLAIAGSGGGTNNNMDGISQRKNPNDAHLFQVEPGEEIEIFKLMIIAGDPGQYHGYIHIKTDRANSVVPVDFSVVEKGLIAIPASLNFGTLISLGEINTLPLHVRNNGPSAVMVMEVVPASNDMQLHIELPEYRIIKAGEEGLAATVRFKAELQGQVESSILLVTNFSNPALATIDIPYRALVLLGGIGHVHFDQSFILPILNKTSHGDKSQIQKILLGQKVIKRNLVLTNYFNIPVVLKSLSANTCGEFITIDKIRKDVIVPRLQKWPTVYLRFHALKALQWSTMPAEDMQLNRLMLPHVCFLDILTNVTSVPYRIPLYIMDGRSFVVSADSVRERRNLFLTNYDILSHRINIILVLYYSHTYSNHSHALIFNCSCSQCIYALITLGCRGHLRRTNGAIAWIFIASTSAEFPP